KYLINYNWPGNIRELKNLIERLVLLATNGIISKNLLPLTITQPSIKKAFSNTLGQPLDKTVANLEISLISNALNTTNNNKTKAAKLLGLPVSTLRTKMDKYGL
ncbi:hypothetical protein MNBD_BACTEROID04-1239, partial [hydrothermal vent metagenome]